MLNPRESVHRIVGEVLAEQGQSVELTDDLPLAELGLNSLDLARVIVTLDFELDAAPFTRDGVPISTVLTVGDLGRTYSQAAPGADAESVDLVGESVLASDINPGSAAAFSPTGDILLTGATGFLGSHLLQELLERTDRDVHCLVRAQDEADGRERLLRALRMNGLPLCDEAATRIHPIAGDLAMPRFGLTDGAYRALSARTTIVVHAAAWINWLFPYAALKPSNVTGTEEVLRFACDTRLKAVHHVSTLGVFSAPEYGGRTLDESEPAIPCGEMPIGYEQTKWVAERLVVQARDRGIPVSVYRSPFLAGHSETGRWNATDLYRLLLQTFLETGVAPALEHDFAAAPVDYVSRAIVGLTLQQVMGGDVFHLSHPSTITWDQLIAWVREAGHSVRLVPVDEWLTTVDCEVRSGGARELAAVWPVFRPHERDGLTILDRMDRTRMPVLGCTGTQKALEGTGIECPPFTAALIDRYAENLGTLSATRQGDREER